MIPKPDSSGAGLSKLLRTTARRYAGKIALIDRQRTLTYHELDHTANGLARRFRDEGLRPGDRVAIHWNNALEVVELMLSCFHAGLIAVRNAHPRYPRRHHPRRAATKMGQAERNLNELYHGPQRDFSKSVSQTRADRYRDKYMGLTMYGDSYREFCKLLPQGRARVLDAACGPGNVSRYLMAQRPDLDLLGIDLAPRMLELAPEAVPSAQFVVQDCRHLAALRRRFDGIICAFGLPYLSPEEVTAFIAAADEALDLGGVLYLSTMLGNSEDSGFQVCSTGDQVYINYHSEEIITQTLGRRGFSLVKRRRMAGPIIASKPTTDLIVIAKREVPPASCDTK